MSVRVKAPSTSAVTRRSPGRPRSLVARDAILRAARALLSAGGPGAVTMEAVAAQAGVGKPTVYRWWSDRHAVTMAALMDEAAPAARSRSPRTSLAALRQQLEAIAARFATPTGRHVTALLAAADAESELSKAFRNHFVLTRRAEGRALVERAMRDGELRRDLDVDVAVDMLYGPLFFRLLMGHAPLDARFAEVLLAEALRGIGR